jgi:hypothetical protein
MSAQLVGSRRVAVLGLEAVVLMALVLLSWAVAQSALMQAQPHFVGFAILVDMTLTAAACHYLLGVRRAGLFAWTVIPVMALGLFVSGTLLPEELTREGTLPLIGIALVESAVLLSALLRVRTIVREYRVARRAGARSASSSPARRSSMSTIRRASTR